ncbi:MULTISPECIES: Rne/Rng family ribonuclease [unclassified Psychrobacter]|uniref:Rne/Rng family ribonuclease n=1 Tax=unclassified Psychrobacter TaxID=196806 RepID=UPI0018F75553|nr:MULTISPECIES: Rne/Rng family ribonuclease [unclassified Psychrobacter]
MSEELLINVSPMESRVAVLDNGVLSEIYIERHNKLGLVGNIYLGTVVRVLPGMQAAFVDIGQSRTAFLHVNDMQRPVTPPAPTKDVTNTSKLGSDSDINREDTNTALSALPAVTTSDMQSAQNLIQHRLHEGQRILVQVTKDQLGSKGARLTTNISLPSRYLVYLPSSTHIGISQRIDSEEERSRLKTELSALMQTVNLQGGVIARTAAERVPVDKLEEDIYYLLQLWRTVCARRQEMNHHQSSELIYQELSLPMRSIRDLVHADTEKVVVDNTQIYEQVRHFAKEFVPFVFDRIIHYTAEQPLFDVHRVEEDLRDALKRRVDLKSGGYLIIDQTEAMTTIDVNTGSFVSGRSLEDTVYKTNLEATHAIARQLRLRNLGGIIILDFIDMIEQEHKDDVLANLQTQLSQDYAKTNITQVSELGLVEMTRKRTRESLEQQLCEPCSTCQGRGFVKTAETVCFEIFREIMRCARTYNSPKKFTVVAHAAVIDLLLTSEADTVADLEYLLGRVITFEVENLYTQEQYDIVLD